MEIVLALCHGFLTLPVLGFGVDGAPYPPARRCRNRAGLACLAVGAGHLSASIPRYPLGKRREVVMERVMDMEMEMMMMLEMEMVMILEKIHHDARSH
jgi:hypothetical protein